MCGMAGKSLLVAATLLATAAGWCVEIDAHSEIVMDANAAYATRLAAEELNFFLGGVFGKPLTVVPKRTPGKTAIVLGGEDARLGALGRDGFVVEAKGDVLSIVGNDDDVRDVAKAAFLPGEAPYQPCFRRGTLFGVYEFLERFAGVRMYFPGELGTCVPRAERIVVAEGRIEGRPAFSVRRYGYADGPVAKDVFNGINVTDFKRVNWYRLRMETEHLACCHGAKTHCLSPSTWESIYTNACALLSSKIKQSNNQTIPTLQKSNNQTIKQSNNPLVFDAMPKDGLTWLRHCRCDWCRKNVPYSKEDIGFATDLVWRRTAELAGKIKKRFPEARVSQMSYIPYARIPTNELPDNVEVFVARRGPWAEGTSIGEREKDEVRAWHEKLGAKVSLWNYPDKVACWNLEMKDIPQLAPRAWASYYRAVAPHVTGAFAESETDRWIYNYLNYYVFSRICWNPDADVEAILAEHHRLMFGAAAKEMSEFFDILEKCWMKVVAKPYDTPLGPGVCEAPTDVQLRTEIYTPKALARLGRLLDAAAAKVPRGSLEARRIALFRREYFEPLDAKMGEALRVGLIADLHISEHNDTSDLKRALRLFDAKKADAVIAAGDLTEYGLLAQLRQVADAWSEVFPRGRRSDGGAISRLFHYGDHDTELNWRVKEREVVEMGRLDDYIPQIGPDIAWERAFGEHFEPVIRRTIKGVEFTLVHHLPPSMKSRFPQLRRASETLAGSGASQFHIFSQHRVYRGYLARPGKGDEIGWDDGASLAFLTNNPSVIAVCGHAHISAVNETSLYRGGEGTGHFTAIQIPSLFYQLETWLPKPKGDHDSHQALFLIIRPGSITIERLDVRTGHHLAPDWTLTANR